MKMRGGNGDRYLYGCYRLSADEYDLCELLQQGMTVALLLLLMVLHLFHFLQQGFFFFIFNAADAECSGCYLLFYDIIQLAVEIELVFIFTFKRGVCRLIIC